MSTDDLNIHFSYAGKPSYGYTKEQLLIRAILEDAIYLYRNGHLYTNKRKKRLFREAKQWIFSDDIQWPFSFVNICYNLGMEPTSVRRKTQMIVWELQKNSGGYLKQQIPQRTSI